MTEDFATSSSSPYGTSSPTIASSSLSKDNQNNLGDTLSSSKESPPHDHLESDLMIKNRNQQTHDHISHRHHKTTDTTTNDDGLLHIENEKQKTSLEELPCLHHSVCIFTCAFTTLTKLKKNHIYP